MKILLTIISSTLLVSCASKMNNWVSPNFDTSQIKTISLHNQSSPEEFDIFACSKPKADGTIILDDNSVRYFCIAKNNQKKFGTIEKSMSNLEICLWAESGFCDDEGMCQGIFSASECRKF